MSYHMYILRCADDSYYNGHTDEIEVRLADHQRGSFSSYTRKRRPVTLVYAEEYNTRDEAFARERQVKGWSRAKKEALIAGNIDRLQRLAKNLH